MQNLRTITSIFLLVLAVLIAQPVAAQTYTTIADGNWSLSGTWLGGSVPPTGSDIPTTAVINIRHTVAYDTGNTLKNHGEIRIEPIAGTTAMLNVPTGINIENHATGEFYIISGSLIQCRFVGCNNGEPYSGTNPGAPSQSGSFKNLSGFMQVENATVEVAQDWTNEAGGDRTVTDSCVRTGQNFSLSGSGSTDAITRSQVSIGWQGSGSFSHADGTAVYDRARFQIAGTSGNFTLNSGTINGNIETIYLRNQIVPFIGSGQIFASASLTTTGISLDEYCVLDPSKYIPNGKFTGSQVVSCTNAGSTCFSPTAAMVSIQGRVFTPDGRGIGNAVIEVFGGTLGSPLRAVTNPFGYYQIDDLEAGHSYLISVQAKRYSFREPSRVVNLYDNLTDVNFISESTGSKLMPSKR